MQQDRQLSVPPEKLRTRCNPDMFSFDTTANVPAPPRMVGQGRAADALEFGLSISDRHYQIYVAGPAGTGRSVATEEIVRRIAATMPTPDDLCYVFNFDQPYSPRPLMLPAGRARLLSDQVDEMIARVSRAVSTVFVSEIFRRRQDAALKPLEEQRKTLRDAFNRQAEDHNFRVRTDGDEPNFIPLKPVGNAPFAERAPYDPQEFAALTDAERAPYQEEFDTVQTLYITMMLAFRDQEREAHTIVVNLMRDMLRETLAPIVAPVRAAFADLPDVGVYLDAMVEDMADNVERLRGETAQKNAPDDEERPAPPAITAVSLLARYRVNVIVDRTGQQGAPFVFEHNPTYYNIAGRLEYGIFQGNPYTDFTFLKAGALHQANGGFLVINIRELGTQPLAWDVIKRTLRTGQLAIENPADPQQPVIATSLKPLSIPITVKIVLIGAFKYWDLLSDDPDFVSMFKVRADFEDSTARTPSSEYFYAQFAGDVAREMRLPPLDRYAVARLVEEGARMADDHARLSLILSDLRDLVIEAGYWARRNPTPEGVIAAQHVHLATQTRRKRFGMIADHLIESVRTGQSIISTSGSAVGQVNALSIIEILGDRIKRVMRVTARAAPGTMGVIDIAREADVSGPTHTKGVLTLESYLRGQYGQEVPLSLSATLSFEQVGEGVDGDSASMAELCALISTLAEIPIAQNLAMTGAVSQWGEMLPIGAVNLKIEGFFEICQILPPPPAGTIQGVIIPETNVRDLMLNLEVVEAVREGRFAIYAVRTVTEALELLMGRPAGRRGADGTYLPGTINALVQEKLHQYADRVRRYRAQG
jgi:predicted ATP-dependent protease